MSFNPSTHFFDLNQFVADICYLFQETAIKYTSTYPEFHQILDEAKRQLGQLYNRLKISEGVYRIAFVGLGNVGKSTLLNALFAKNITISWNGPCTAFPIEIQKAYDDRLDLLVIRRGKAFIKEHFSFDTEDELLDKLKDLMYDDELLKVKLRLNSCLLSEQVAIVDTPGFGAVQANKQGPNHEESVTDYLRTNVAQIFWVVTGANGGIGKREKDFYSDLLKEYCDDLIVTRTEDWDDDDKAKFVRRYRKELHNPFARFFFVSATTGIEARQKKDSQLLSLSGIHQLESRIRSLSDSDKRSEQIQRSMKELFQNLIIHVREEIQPNRYCRADWHPTEWEKIKAKYSNSAVGVSFLESLKL